MKKNKQRKSEKPSSIIKLERIYGVLLRESKSDFNIESGLPEQSFCVDSSGKVIGLSIAGANITDVTPIGELEDLEYLNITHNSISDIFPIFPQPKLKHLYMGGNKVKDLSPLLQSPYLIDLVIWDNPIVDFTPISKMSKLEALYCQNTGLENLSIIQNLKNLKQLSVEENDIQNLDVITSLSNLEEIGLDGNFITDISALEQLKKPISLDLASNKVKYLPRAVSEKFDNIYIEHYIPFGNDNLGDLSLFNNPLEYPPASVIDLGKETLINYYDTAEQFGHAPLSEGRIIVVGDGSAGKSSLIERVLYNTFEQGKSQTNGIRIENWNLTHSDGRDLIFHIWDFGGQEIQHAVHKFFFTEGCLYVLVLDNRKEEEPEYWLQQIDSLAGSAPVLVVFNKQDDNTTEIADRKFLKEKYPNIIGFYNTSCRTGLGISEFKEELENQVVRLRTVDEQFPNNWFRIKKAIEEYTSGDQHYLNFDHYREICSMNEANSEHTQKLLLKYFTTIGAVTWFGDTYLNFLHVLSPAWITEGVYKIITSKKTAKLYGHVNISDFKELLKPISTKDYTYDENHYGYILSMMKKFDLCYTPDDENILLPSAFGKEPKLEYSEFRGDQVRTYILQFKDYMPLALIHRFIAKRLSDAYESNYWYSGIVIRDNKSSSLAMVQADKEAKRIYVRIKGDSKLGMWEHIRREMDGVSSSYANINYNELIALDDRSEATVNYEDLVSHIKANKSIYFHPKLQKDFNVGFLIGLFESKEITIDKFTKGELNQHKYLERSDNYLPFVINILNNNSPNVNTQVNNHINIDIDIQIVNNISSSIKGEAVYLLEELGETNKLLRDTLQKVINFADDSRSSTYSSDIKEKGWGRKLKNIIQVLGTSGEQLKNIEDGSEALSNILNGIKDLALQFDLDDIISLAMKALQH